jgi:N-acetyl sugar amidotransferase
MPLVGKVCTKGVWDESIPGIRFDDQGVSNYARLFEKLTEAYPRGEKGLEEWKQFVQKIKQHGKNKRYDCIIGVSGGTDSSYLLHIAKDYGLRPLAVNLDNGWNSDISVKNIKKMTNALDIDLETYVVNYNEIKDLIKAYMYSGLPWIDMPTDLAIKSVLYKIANREGIKYFLRGNDFRSEGTQPTEWTYGDGRQLNALHRKYGKVKLHTFPNYTLSNLVFYGFIRGIKSIYPFYYLDYQKNQAQKFLAEKYNWEYYGGHHFENTFTRFAIAYWAYEKFGIDKRKITLSAQVMSGEISHDDALQQLSRPPYKAEEKEMMVEFFLKKLDLAKEEFEKILSSPNHSYTDYPSYGIIMNNMSKLAATVLKRILVHKPQSAYKSEIIDKP